MSTLGSLHILAPEIPDGLTSWRLQVRVDDGQAPGAMPIYETLLLSDGELKRIRERAAKRPTAILANPAPEVNRAAYDSLVVEIGKMRASRDAAEAALSKQEMALSKQDTARGAAEAALAANRDLLAGTQDDLAATRGLLASTQADLVAARADLEAAHSDIAALRADLSVTASDLDTARDRLRTAMEAADRLQAELTQSEALRVAQVPEVLSPWANLGLAIRRVLGL